jgi:hypothetical protein
MKPKLVVDTVSPFPRDQEPTRIRATIPSRASKEEEARAFFVIVRNTGRKTAEDVRPLVNVSGKGGAAFLVMVPPHPGPVMEFEWPGTQDQFDHDEDALATALVYAEKTRERSVTLNPKGMGKGFVLFFTIRGRGLYFPSETKIAVMFPTEFDLTLRFEMHGRGITEAKRYVVQANAWNSFTVTELEPKSRFHYFRKSHQQTQVVFAPINDRS